MTRGAKRASRRVTFEQHTSAARPCLGEGPPLTASPLCPPSGHLVSLLPRVRRGAQAAGGGRPWGAEAGQGLLRFPSAPHCPLGGEGAGWRRPAGHRRVLPAVCADGVQRREAEVHPGHGDAA